MQACVLPEVAESADFFLLLISMNMINMTNAI